MTDLSICYESVVELLMILTTHRIGQRSGISAVDYYTVTLWIPTTNTFSFSNFVIFPLICINDSIIITSIVRSPNQQSIKLYHYKQGGSLRSPPAKSEYHVSL